MNNLPQKIKLTIHGEEIDFSLTDKREIKYYGKTETSNESLWRTDKLEDNEVFYQTEWGWCVFVKIEERGLSLEERYELVRVNGLCPKYSFEIEDGKPVPNKLSEKEWYDNFDIPTKLITLTYKNEKIESYE